MWRPAPGNAVVAVRSSLKFGLVDWGKNRRNIEALFARIDELLRSPRSVAPTVANRPDASPGWYWDQTSRHELRYWSGTAWTPYFSDGGVVGADPS